MTQFITFSEKYGMVINRAQIVAFGIREGKKGGWEIVFQMTCGDQVVTFDTEQHARNAAQLIIDGKP